MTNSLSNDRQFLIHSLHSRAAQEKARIWTRGRGAVLYDQDGNEVLDALAGLWNVVLGHGRAELADAAARQMRELAYATCYTGSSNPRAIELGEAIAEVCYPSIRRYFFTSGGAEANESAFKTARYYWKLAGRPEKTKFIGRRFGYHGTTMAAMSATGLASYWPMFEPRVPGFSHVDSPYPYRFTFAPRGPDDRRTPGQAAADLLEEEILRQGPDTVAGFIGEPVQGGGGVIVPPDDYWPRIRQICDRHNVLLIADEVITGFGRTGEWFALGRYGIEPDIVTFAKALTSGYFPLGGMGVSQRIAEAIDRGAEATTWMHAFTYSAHPVGCAVALETLRILKAEGLVQRAAELGGQLLRGLKTLASHPHVGDVRGLGLMAAVEVVADKATKAEYPPEAKVGPRLLATALQRGMFTRMRGEVYNFAPCYVAEERQIDRMVEILGETVEEVTKG
jgi:adenosylmethionine-8-amino-7-oxononanoate aminotransferase